MRTLTAFGVVLGVVAGAFLSLSPTSAVGTGSLIRGSAPAVYYLGPDGKRYVFPNAATYFTWYADFDGVVTISDAALAAYPIGGNVTYRPGTRMVKIQSDPKTYAVDADGTLRWITSEAVAVALYGSAWNTMIDDVSDAFFVNYRTGDPLTSASDYDRSAVRNAATTIAVDRGLSVAQERTPIDLTSLPLGDDKYSTSPQKGYVYSCQSSFTGGGAFTQGSWIHGDTWDLTSKYVVDGSVSWPSATVAVTVQGNDRVISGNGLPDHVTGTYPISSTDDAYTVDRNPNSISAQDLMATIPANPTLAASPSCVPGEVGIAVNGVAILNGFDAGGRDAVATEVQDSCDGHPQEAGQYHYHGPSSCVSTGDSELFGWAWDGFGIFSNLEDGVALTNDDLDECHGHSHAIEWDGAAKEMYHYHLTNEFPYTVGCFMGTSAWTGPTAGGQQGGQLPPPPGGGPPRF